MALYQQSVLKKYLAAQHPDLVKAGFERFKAYFLHAERQENIRNMKEEQFQEGFLRELFVNVLGYTINPEPGFNLTTELKNIKDAKKTDGAILKDGNALAVIELKGTDTKDLDKVSEQAFNYKNNQPECVYVVTSNFEKLRFYIHNAVEHEEFNLFKMTEERFALLWLFLQKDNLLGGIAQKVKEESLQEEKNVTNRLYKDYSAFKQQLWQNMVLRNPQHDPLLLYKKSQKLLDRILFILFAEDKGLLPPNSIIQIVQHWEKLSELDEAKPLYYMFLKYFGYMDTGRKAQGTKAEIHAYNGGLFAPDELLDNLVLDDEVLQRHCLKLCTYNFESEVDTNILGHIFEHSLNDIEAVRAELAGEVLDQSKTKRKKDGVFYTPKYITKYIVENTVGRLCEEKKAAIGIDDEEFGKDRKGRKKETLKRLDDQLKAYRDWLLQLTICDPACGSGAFLNQALEFLMAEHRYVDELEAQLLGHSFEFPGVEAHILEHNIYGVDINEESVEIARLSLWLRTAKKGRKLTTLSSNIKVGNSLIDNPQVAGELAFEWKREFPQVFDKGGFDVVIGNPPYVPGKSLETDFKAYVKKTFKLITGKYDLYLLFIERILGITGANGLWGVIIPNTIMVNENGTLLRKHIVSNHKLGKLRLFKDDVFPDASVESVVLISAHNGHEIELFDYLGDAIGRAKNTDVIADSFCRIQLSVSVGDSAVISKINSVSIPLNNLVEICIGIQLGGSGDSAFFKEQYISSRKNEEHFKPFLDGKDYEPYITNWSGKYIAYGDWLHRKRDERYFLNEKILIRQIGATPVATIDREQYYCLNTIYCMIRREDCKHSLEVLFGIIQSKLVKYYWQKLFSDNKVLFPKIKKSQLVQIPIVRGLSESTENQFRELVMSHFQKSKLLHECKIEFTEFLKSKVAIDKLSTKLQNWPTFDFRGFLAELKKAKVQLNLSEEAEWMTYFNAQKQKANALQAEIDRLDKEIDQMVYRLYGLTEEEIKIVKQ
jgi:type I restriction-modification system DNA methylase subunit